MLFPNNLHEYALKKIGRYLIQTRNRGLILNTNREILNIDSYPDADCAGIYGHENPDDTSFVQSCISYRIKFSYCPVLKKSKLYTETSLLPM